MPVDTCIGKPMQQGDPPRGQDQSALDAGGRSGQFGGYVMVAEVEQVGMSGLFLSCRSACRGGQGWAKKPSTAFCALPSAEDALDCPSQTLSRSVCTSWVIWSAWSVIG